MSLLDEDSEKIKKAAEGSATEAGKKKSRTGKRAGSAGLGMRFGSLNKFSNQTKDFRKKQPEPNQDILIEKSKRRTLEPQEASPLKKQAKPLEEIITPKNSLKPPKSTGATNQLTNSKQIVSKQETNRKQIVSDQLANRKQTVNQSDSKTVSKADVENLKEKLNFAKPSTVVDNLKTRSVNDAFNHRDLTGNERHLLYFIYHECLREGELITGKLPIHILADHINTTTNTTKVTLTRMKKKGILFVAERKLGRSGWSRYAITKDLYQDIQTDEKGFHEGLEKRLTKQLAKQLTKASSSSSNLNNKTTTEPIAEEWLQIQIPRNIRAIGFSRGQIIQVFKAGILTAVVLETSLDHFAHDLERGAIKTTTGPLNYLMGVLIKNQSLYISEDLMATLRRERDEKSKLMEEYKSLQKKMITEELIAKFDSWWLELDQVQRNKVAPPNAIAREGSEAQERVARGLFFENPRIAE